MSDIGHWSADSSTPVEFFAYCPLVEGGEWLGWGDPCGGLGFARRGGFLRVMGWEVFFVRDWGLFMLGACYWWWVGRVFVG